MGGGGAGGCGARGEGGSNSLLYKKLIFVVLFSELRARGASRAIDGNTSGDYSGQNSCTHTDNQAGNWWEVTLPVGYAITSVRIYNRDGNYNRLEKTKVRVDNYDCGITSDNIDTAAPIDIACAGAPTTLGTSVLRLYKEDGLSGNQRTLTLCEVKVFGVKHPGPVSVEGTGSVEECERRCLLHPLCWAYDYETSGSNKCKLIRLDPERDPEALIAVGVIFCFHRPAVRVISEMELVLGGCLRAMRCDSGTRVLARHRVLARVRRVGGKASGKSGFTKCSQSSSLRR